MNIHIRPMHYELQVSTKYKLISQIQDKDLRHLLNPDHHGAKLSLHKKHRESRDSINVFVEEL